MSDNDKWKSTIIWDYEDEDDDDDYEGIPQCCAACGGPYPDCMTACSIFDD